MTNEKKLELTLCGMLPYGLKVLAKTNNSIIDVRAEPYTLNTISIHSVLRSGEMFKPLLYSLDKLTIEHYS